MIFEDTDEGENCSRIINKSSGGVTPIRLNGIYEFDMWIKCKKTARQQQAKPVATTAVRNAFAAIAEDELDATGGHSGYSQPCCRRDSREDPFQWHP